MQKDEEKTADILPYEGRLVDLYELDRQEDIKTRYFGLEQVVVREIPAFMSFIHNIAIKKLAEGNPFLTNSDIQAVLRTHAKKQLEKSLDLEDVLNWFFDEPPDLANRLELIRLDLRVRDTPWKKTREEMCRDQPGRYFTTYILELGDGLYVESRLDTLRTGVFSRNTLERDDWLFLGLESGGKIAKKLPNPPFINELLSSAFRRDITLVQFNKVCCAYLCIEKHKRRYELTDFMNYQRFYELNKT